jgi:gluconolactonase
MTMNPLKDFRVDLADIRHAGQGLSRPVCILADREGSLWAADSRGGIMHLAASGEQHLILPDDAPAISDARHAETGGDLLYGSLPNGLAFDADGNLLIANIGTDRVELLTRSGKMRVLLDRVDGRPMGKVNFVSRDSRGRLWITVSTRRDPWAAAICSNCADGYIVLLDEKGPRIVADGLAFTNEARLDEREEFLYVAETTAKRVSRFQILDGGALGSRETYGPDQLGVGLIDGITFDAYGNLWCAMTLADRLVAIDPEGQLITLLDDGASAATEQFEAAFSTGEVVPMEILDACGGTIAPLLTSITFGGPDLKTVYLGSLKGSSIPFFSSPVGGLPLAHW